MADESQKTYMGVPVQELPYMGENRSEIPSRHLAPVFEGTVIGLSIQTKSATDFHAPINHVTVALLSEEEKDRHFLTFEVEGDREDSAHPNYQANLLKKLKAAFAEGNKVHIPNVKQDEGTQNYLTMVGNDPYLRVMSQAPTQRAEKSYKFATGNGGVLNPKAY